MSRWLERLLLVFCCLSPLTVPAEDYPPLQPLIDETPEGETLVPPPGIYAGPVRITRPINLDVGYVAPAKLVLASMKDFAHRIYLGRGVYAEITLQYRKGRWESLHWTFPDYASRAYDAFLTEVRHRLVRREST